MIATEYYNSPKAELKVITQNGDAPMHAIPGEEKLSASALMPESLKDTADIFSIAFTYNDRLYKTKVLKAGTADKDSFYKVALSSALIHGNGIYWLQRRENGWTSLLSKEINSDLLTAITSAIDELNK